MSKVYVRVDTQSRVVEINSDDFLVDTTGWDQIDEGMGDKYHHAQGNYLPGGLTTAQGIYRYKLADGHLAERTPEEIQEDIDAMPPPEPTAQELTEKAAKVMFRALAQTDVITPVDALDNAGMFPLWADRVGKFAEAGSYWRHEGGLYRVNAGQGHTIQADWAPDQAVSLFSRVADPAEEWPEWIQPTGAHNAYPIGAKCSHGGKRWINEADNNAYEPGVYGWREVPL